VRGELERVEIPAERAASERAWRVLRSAFAEVEPRPPARRPGGLLAWAAAAAIVALVVVAVSPAGPALVRTVRSAVGSGHAEQALVALPSAGRLLVDSDGGPWIVNADGSKRLLGRYASSSWSPHGLFELVVRGHELAALGQADLAGSFFSLDKGSTVRVDVGIGVLDTFVDAALAAPG